ncbi:MAG: hypothetical protein K1X92_13445 [Bacteroidia bacterium]|nr:hypothetical protein [Bacteroidia bacterium]
MKWLLLLAAFMTSAHPFYMSITQIDYRPDSRSLEISTKIFTEDLENAIENTSGKKIKLFTAQESKDADALISGYLKNNFSISVNEQPVSWKFIGKQKEDDAVWIYLEAENVSKINTCSITNTVLTEKFDSQNNIIHLNASGQKKSYILSRNSPSVKVAF